MSEGSRGLWVLLVAIVLGVIAATTVFLAGDGDAEQRAPAPARGRVIGTVEGGELAALEGPPAGARSENPAGLESAPGTLEERKTVVTSPAPFRGRIVDTIGLPIAGAQVSFTAVDQVDPFDRTDADGRFALTVPLSAGTRFEASPRPAPALAVTSPNHVPASFRIDSFAFQTFVLHALPVVTGRVLAPDGLPVTGNGRVQLTVRDAAGQAHEHDADLDANGEFRVEGLAVGRLERAWAHAKGYPEHEEARSEELAPDTIVSVDLALSAGAIVTGRVIDAETKAAVAGASVWADSRTFEPDGLHPAGVTDALGEFELQGVAPRRHVMDDGRVVAVVFLLARAEGYTEAPLRAYAAEWVEGGSYEFELELESARGFLAGVVLQPDGETSAQGAHVHLIDGLGNWRFAQTNRDGEFDFQELPLGTVELMARLGELGDEGGGLLVQGLYVVEAGVSPACRLVLAGAGSTAIRGRVVDAFGMPRRGVRVKARFQFHVGGLSMGIDSAFATTDEAGDYAIVNLSPGRYAVGPEGAGFCTSPESRRATLEQDEVGIGFDFTLRPCMRVSGRVNEGAHPARDLALVLVDSATGDETAGTRPDEDGTFEFEPIPTGVYDLRLSWGSTMLTSLGVGPGDATGLVLDQ